MQCNHCGKYIPSTQKTCMFCNQVVDPNAKYVPSDEELGTLENTDYDTKLNIHVVNDYLKNPKYKKYKYIFIGLVVFLILLIIFIIFAVFGGSKSSKSDTFTNEVDNIYEYVDDNLFYKNGHTGTSSIDISYKTSSKTINYYFDGSYVFDPINKYYEFSGTLDPKYSTDDIRMNSESLPFNLLIRDNNFYLNSESLYDKALYSDISFLNEYLNFKAYDIDKLTEGFKDSLIDSLKDMSYQTSSEKINFRGDKVNSTKVSLELDSTNMYKFLSTLDNNLSETSKFVNQLGQIKEMDKNQIKSYLNDLTKIYEYKYNNSNKDIITINLYTQGSKVIRYELISKTNNLTKKYVLDKKDKDYYFDYYENDKNKASGTLIYTEKELTNKHHGEINITFDTDDYLTDIKIKYDDDKKPAYKKQSFEEITDFNSLSDEEYLQIKNKFGTLIEEDYLLDRLRNLFLSDCSSDLECNCSDLTCLCKLDDKYITCPRKLVNK